MRNDERLRTIYEVMAPYIVRNEHNWRDYLAFASQFHKHSFDNILLVYAQDEDVSILATRKQWAAIWVPSGFPLSITANSCMKPSRPADMKRSSRAATTGTALTLSISPISSNKFRIHSRTYPEAVRCFFNWCRSWRLRKSKIDTAASSYCRREIA